jgi:hypothetical protein
MKGNLTMLFVPQHMQKRIQRDTNTFVLGFDPKEEEIDDDDIDGDDGEDGFDDWDSDIDEDEDE